MKNLIVILLLLLFFSCSSSIQNEDRIDVKKSDLKYGDSVGVSPGGDDGDELIGHKAKAHYKRVIIPGKKENGWKATYGYSYVHGYGTSESAAKQDAKNNVPSGGIFIWVQLIY